MIQLRSLKIAVLALSLLISTALVATAQQAPGLDTNYDITLQLVIGSNDAGAKNELPANLSATLRQMKSDFAFTSYRLASTFVGRIANNGHFEYNSVATIDGKDMASSVPTFLDWSLRDLHVVPGSKSLQAQAFRFGAKVPVAVGDSSKGATAINYENLGVGLTRVGLHENTPTLIGTLHLPGTSGTIFLVMTIRPTDS